MILTLLLSGWRYIAGAMAILGIIGVIYYHGYEASQERIRDAEQKAESLEKARSSVALKAVTDQAEQQKRKADDVQNKLDALVKKYNKLHACNVSIDGVRDFNSLDQ